MSVDILLVGCVAAPIVLFVIAYIAASMHRGRTHRAGMERYRAACRALGLTQTPQFWEGTVDGVRVGTHWVRYRLRTTGGGPRYRRFTSYHAWFPAPLGIDLDTFGQARPSIHDGGYIAEIEPWRRGPRPPRVWPDIPGVPMHLHAADPAAAHAWFGRPEVGAAIRAAVAASWDVRLTDHEVELIEETYQGDPAELDRRLRLAATLVRALAPPPPGVEHIG